MKRTPSGFHDDAYRRDAGHDAMQREVLEHLRSRPPGGFPYSCEVTSRVESELPFYRNGEIVGFADAAEWVTASGVSTTLTLYEIKPRIYTVFGLARQAKALHALGSKLPGLRWCACIVVVPRSDPQFAGLMSEWPYVLGWPPERARY